MSENLSELVAKFQERGGQIAQLPTIEKKSALFLVKILKAREQLDVNDKVFGTYLYVELIRNYDYPVTLPEKFGIVTTKEELARAVVGDVYVMPVRRFIPHEESKKKHNILFRTRAPFYKPGSELELVVKKKTESPVAVVAKTPKAEPRPKEAPKQEPRIADPFNKGASLSLIEVLEKSKAKHRILWANGKHPERLALTTSFGIQAAVLLHMAKQALPDLPIITIDTQHLHPETYRYKQTLIERLDLRKNLRIYRADMSAAEQMALYGQRWKDGKASDEYKLQNKVEPMNRAVKELGLTGWITGIRRGQSAARAERPVIEQQGKIQKINALIDWTSRDVFNYMKEFDLPQHPLWNEGYTTVGDYFEPLENRDECGLHDLGVIRPLNYEI